MNGLRALILSSTFLLLMPALAQAELACGGDDQTSPPALNGVTITPNVIPPTKTCKTNSGPCVTCKVDRLCTGNACTFGSCTVVRVFNGSGVTEKCACLSDCPTCSSCPTCGKAECDATAGCGYRMRKEGGVEKKVCLDLEHCGCDGCTLH